MQSNQKFIYYNQVVSKQLFSSPYFRSFLLLLFINFTFSLILEINNYILPRFLKSKYFLQSYLDYVEILENFIYLIAGVVFLQIVNLLKMRRIIIFGLGYFLFTIANIIILDIHNLLKIHLLLMSFATFAVIISSIIQILNYNLGFIGITLFIISYFLGFITAHLGTAYLQVMDLNFSTAVSLSLSGLIFVASFFIQSTKNPIILPKFRFSSLMRNIDLILISGFVISYIFTSIYWQYDIWVVTKSLLIQDIKTIWLCMSAASIISSRLIVFLIGKCNKHFLNILFGIMLLISYVIFIYLYNNIIITVISSCMLGISLYSILLCNLATLIRRFEKTILNTAIILYFTILSLGGYFGIICAEAILDRPAEDIYNFSSLPIIVIYLGYYILQFFSNKLYK